MEKILLNNEQLSIIEKNLENFQVKKSFINKALGLKKIYLPRVKSSAYSYEDARARWRLSSPRGKEERIALIGMIKFAIRVDDYERLLLDAYDLANKSLDKTGQMLIIRAMAQIILKESLVYCA